MRDLKECQQEVFRRSAERIEKRKRRLRIFVSAMIPVMLCLVLVCTVFLPGASGENGVELGAPEGQLDGLTGSTNNILTEPAVSVEGYRLSLTYTEASDIQRIAEYLNGFSLRGIESENDNTDRAESGTGDNFSTTIADSAHSGIYITVVTEAARTEFYLTENRLRNITTEEEYPLTPQVAKELKTLLGLPGEGG